MKIKIKNSTALLLATVLVFSIGVFTLRTERFQKVKADTTISTECDNYAQSYFKNLTENFGHNYKESCTHIAAAMLLSYYDNCLSDDIIPEAYDVEYVSNSANVYNSQKSPGTLHDTISVAEWKIIKGITPVAGDEDIPISSVQKNAMTIEEYMSIVESKKEESLHYKLITIGDESHNYISEGDCGMYGSELGWIIPNFLDEETEYENNTDYSIENPYYRVPNEYEMTAVRNAAKIIVQSGQPIVLFIQKESGGGHAVVAYDYNESENKFICHFGWHDEILEVGATPESKGYTKVRGYLAINWNIEHSCSNNYVVNGTSYCYEHKDLVVFDHLCSYTDGYQTFPRTDPNEHIKHKKMCHCTNYVVENHTSTCGCSRSSHQTNMYSYYNSTKHSAICNICGEVYYANHVVQIENPGYCIACESYFDSGFGEIIHPENLNGRLVTANGSYVGLYGIIYLDERDVEAYFNGTLVFYKEDSSAQTA